MGWLADLLQEIPLSAALKVKLEKVETEHEKTKRDLADAQREVQRLNAELKQFQNQGQGHLENEETAIIQLLAQHGGYLNVDEVAGHLQVHRTKAQHFLNKLEQAEYLRAAHNYLHGTSYGLSQQGQAYAVEQGFV